MAKSSRSEKAIQNDTLVALSALPETMVWRNNTGVAWHGEEQRVAPGTRIIVTSDMLILRKARPVKYGLPGSADILGSHRGLAVAVEIKTLTGRQSEQQRNFQAAWTAAGGIYLLVTSPDQAIYGLTHSKIDLTESNT